MSKVLSRISDLINEYREKKDSLPIIEIIGIGDELSTWSYNLAEMLKDAHEDLSRTEFRKERELHEAYVRYREDGESATGANTFAKRHVIKEGYLEAEKTAESYLKGIRVLLNQANAVHDQIRTRISYMKIEEERARYET